VTTTTFENRGDRELVITRVLDAPRELVWAAWTDPKHLPHWYGAKGWTLPVCEVDLRPGGSYRFVQAGPDASTMTSFGVYREVTPPERLVCTEAFEGVAGEAVNTLTFAEDGGSTRLTIEVLYPTPEVRDAMLETRMKDGVSESFDRLDAHLGGRVAHTTIAMKFELVPVPVVDVDRAKAFYKDKLGFVEDVDVVISDGVRICQLTPPTSACSIVLGTGLPQLEMPVGSLRGLHLVVKDIKEAREELVARGVEMGEIADVGRGVLYSAFSDPDGNTWTLQEMPWRSGDF
jgi:uncharacterized protein YndB with AHSA1/START domain/catechol 2,3-dioxygenase-like lactoylglutathione lyase family enzyme